MIARAKKGIVAASRQEAIGIGTAVLEAGGNAIDAAVATSFALGVAEPYMSGIGGVGEIVVGQPSGEVVVVDAAARAPLAATPEMFDVVGDAEGLYAWRRVANDANIYGARSVTAPQIVPALYLLHARYGRMPWSDLVRPAIDLARKGTILDHFTAAVLVHERPTFERDRLARELFYDGGINAPIDGNPRVLLNPGLADALDLIARDGAAPMLAGGEITAAIVEAVRADGGILAEEDFGFGEDRLLRDVPAYGDFHGWAIYGSPKPSGAVSAWDILSGLAPAAARAADPSRYVDFARSSRDAFRRRLSVLSGEGAANGPSTATTHFSIAATDGTVVSLTQTLLSLYGAQMGVSPFGFFLNNGMMWFDPEAGRANSIEGGRRALMAVSPMIAMNGTRTRRFAVGALGARRIISAVAQIVDNRLRYGDAPQAAVNRPRIHADSIAAVQVDHRLPEAVFSALAAEGPVERVYHGPTTLNSARAFMASVDTRTGDLAAGYDQRAMSSWDMSGGFFDE